jgi:hypothetical protein
VIIHDITTSSAMRGIYTSFWPLLPSNKQASLAKWYSVSLVMRRSLVRFQYEARAAQRASFFASCFMELEAVPTHKIKGSDENTGLSIGDGACSVSAPFFQAGPCGVGPNWLSGLMSTRPIPLSFHHKYRSSMMDARFVCDFWCLTDAITGFTWRNKM